MTPADNEKRDAYLEELENKVERYSKRLAELEARIAELEEKTASPWDRIFVAGVGTIEGKFVSGPHGRIFVEKDGKHYRLL